MVQHCRKHGVDIYVDVVINHMAGGSLGDPRAVGRAGTPWQYRCNAFQTCKDNPGILLHSAQRR